MVRTTIMADKEVLYKIGRIAEKSGKSKAHIIREALAEYIADVEADSSDEAFENPFMALVGLVEKANEEAGISAPEPTPIDWENREHKKIYAEYLNEKYERISKEKSVLFIF